MLISTGAARAGTNIITYHYDNLRTGWNASETQLTPAIVSGGGFGLLHQVKLDEQVDAQPLFVSGQTIAGHGKYDIVYVVTENDTVYAIDAKTGKVILTKSLGNAVPISDLPGRCNNNSDRMGVNSTPVIDLDAGLLYVMADAVENGSPTYRLHALSLSTLADAIPSVVVSASVALTNGDAFPFQARYQRQRAALLETSGSIYAGFASYCDVSAEHSRGWVLGWNSTTLKPLPSAQLIDRQAKDADHFFLSSVWMAGYGIASDDNGSLFFVTGNSDPNGKTYHPGTNLEESAVRVSADLTTVQGYYTPANHAGLDAADNDFGSGGMLLLPAQKGSALKLAVAAGKTDSLYLLDRDHLGGPGNKHGLLGSYANGGCWCGPAYYRGADGVGRVVTSTGHNITVWQVQITPQVALSAESSGPQLNSGQDPGFFTTVSSHGTASPVIWALPRPADSDSAHTVTLAAFDPENGSSQLFSGAAGSWPNAANADANLVPVVANGHVFVASYKTLSIFGVSAANSFAQFTPEAAPPSDENSTPRHQVFGTALSLRNDLLTIRDRAGIIRTVDVSRARKTAALSPVSPGHAVLCRGDSEQDGRLQAEFVLHVKDSPLLWGNDR